jgi:hypothetical protein
MAITAVVFALVVGQTAPAAAALRVVDVSAAAGVADITNTWSAEAGDINGDGADDLLIGNHHSKPAYLYVTTTTGRSPGSPRTRFRLATATIARSATRTRTGSETSTARSAGRGDRA